MEEVHQDRAKAAIHLAQEAVVTQAADQVQGAVEVPACFRQKQRIHAVAFVACVG